MLHVHPLPLSSPPIPYLAARAAASLDAAATAAAAAHEGSHAYMPPASPLSPSTIPGSQSSSLTGCSCHSCRRRARGLPCIHAARLRGGWQRASSPSAPRTGAGSETIPSPSTAKHPLIRAECPRLVPAASVRAGPCGVAPGGFIRPQGWGRQCFNGSFTPRSCVGRRGSSSSGGGDGGGSSGGASGGGVAGGGGGGGHEERSRVGRKGRGGVVAAVRQAGVAEGAAGRMAQ